MAALLVIYLILSLQWLPCDASCANMCSGHGQCGGANICTCDSGWNIVPDCSRRACPTGIAWVDKASAPNKAHVNAIECSNRGVCDYYTGECICAQGFTGDACQRSRCPNDCSGHGVCQTLANLAIAYGPQTIATGVGPTYTNWEANSMTGCYCDMGFTGPDCSMRACPKNDDPLTTGQVYRTIALTVSAVGSALAGTVSVTFNGFTFTMPANANSNSNSICASAVMTLGNVVKATCTISGQDSTTQGATYTIAFLEWAHRNAENNIFSHSGNPPLTAFSCNVAGVTSNNSPSCSFADVVSLNVIEHEYCSRRGICDFTTGLCTCFLAYKNSDCNQPSNIPDNIDDHDGFLINPTGPSYIGSALHIVTAKAMATDFNMILAEASSAKVFQMDGAGNTWWYSGNLRVEAGTLFVQAGEQIATGGLYIADGGCTSTITTVVGPASNAIATATGFTGTVMNVQTTQATGTNFYLFKASTSGLTVPQFDVRGDGQTTIHTGGLNVVLGGATITDNIAATSVTSIQATHASYTGSVVSISASRLSQFPATDFNLITASAGGTTALTIEASGKTTLTNGGLYVNGIGGGNFVNQDPTSSALSVLSDNTAFNGVVANIQASATPSTNFYLLQALSNSILMFSIQGDGLTRVHSGGLKVLAVGQTIQVGGLYVNSGGITINTGGLKVLNGGATISTQGLIVLDGGADVTNSAQLVPAWAAHSSHSTFQSSVALIETTLLGPSSTFQLLQLKSASTIIFEIRGDGLTTIYQGGLSIRTGGLTIAEGGETIQSSSSTNPVTTITASSTSFAGSVLQVSSHTTSATNFYFFSALSSTATAVFDIRSTGLTTIHSGGLSVTNGGVTIDAVGLTVSTIGATITNGALTVTSNDASAGVTTLTASSSSYTGSVLTAISATSSAINFYLFSALIATNTPIFDIRGDGLTTIRAGGLSIIAGGVTVTDGGGTIKTSSTSVSAVTVTATSNAYTGTVLKAITATSSATNFNLFSALIATSTPIFDIRGDGLTTIHAGGLSVTNGGVTIDAVGLTVSTIGATITNGALTVTSNDASAGVTTLTASSSSYTGSVLTAISATSSAINFYLFSALIATNTPIFDIRGDGLTTIRAGGLSIIAGGVTVTDGGGTIKTSSTSVSAVTVTATSNAYTGTVLKAITATSSATNFNLFSALIATSTPIFDIRGDGLTTIHAGGLSVTNG
ncbi:hypothetical protein AeRB84_018367, partial [Aphanomyces euteiches]